MKKLALALVVLALLAVPAMTQTPSAAGLLRFVPAAAQVVVGTDVAALRSHPLVQSWLLQHQAPWSGADDQAAEFLRDAGIDPARDVDSMLVAVTPGSVEGHGVAIFGGRFDPTSLGAALVKRGAAATSVAGVSAYKLTERSEHQGQAPYLVAREDTVIVGDESSMTEVLAEASSGNLLVQREVDAGRVDLRAPFWMVAALPPEMREHLATRTPAAGEGGDPAAQAVVTAARTIRRVTMQATLGESLEIKGLAEADTAENAELLRDAVKGALAAVRLQTQDQYPELVEVLRDVKITLDGTEVQGSGAIPVALIEKLAQHRHGECRHVI